MRWCTAWLLQWDWLRGQYSAHRNGWCCVVTSGEPLYGYRRTLWPGRPGWLWRSSQWTSFLRLVLGSAPLYSRSLLSPLSGPWWGRSTAWCSSGWCKATVRKMKQNLVWASVYNVLAIPVAAGVLYPAYGIMLRPEWSALLMSVSSIIVAVNAVLLKGFEGELDESKSDGRPPEPFLSK